MTENPVANIFDNKYKQACFTWENPIDKFHNQLTLETLQMIHLIFSRGLLRRK